LEAAQNWRELAPHYFPADCFEGSSKLAGTVSTLFSGGLSEKETYDVFLVQQHFSYQIGLCLQVKGIPVSCYVHQHQFLKF
jgi:hypothetical protein